MGAPHDLWGFFSCSGVVGAPHDPWGSLSPLTVSRKEVMIAFLLAVGCFPAHRGGKEGFGAGRGELWGTLTCGSLLSH